MPKSIILEFTDRSTTPEKVKVVFSDEEWKRLSSFLDEARRLFETPAIKQGLLTMKQEISWKAGVGVTATGSLPADDVIAVVLHRLRPFLLQKESSNFLSICNLLHKRLDHPALRASIAYFRELFDGRSFQALMTARSATLVLNSLETFMKWVNAFEYHRDPELRQEIEDAHTIVPLESTKGMMVYMMIEMCKAIGGIGELLNAMKEGKGTEVQLTRKAPRAGEGDVKKAEAGPTAGT